MDPDKQYNTIIFLRAWWALIQILFWSIPFLAMAIWHFTEFLQGTPEPELWLLFESQIMEAFRGQ